MHVIIFFDSGKSKTTLKQISVDPSERNTIYSNFSEQTFDTVLPENSSVIQDLPTDSETRGSNSMVSHDSTTGRDYLTEDDVRQDPPLTDIRDTVSLKTSTVKLIGKKQKIEKSRLHW